MAIPERLKLATAQPEFQWLVTDDGSRTLVDVQASETYHSGCGALEESLLVYTINSGLARLLDERGRASALEYGLGTGTCFLLTAAYAACSDAALDYVAIENRLLPSSILSELRLPEAIERWQTADAILKVPPNFCAQVASIHRELCSCWEHLQHAPQNEFVECRISETIQLRIWHGDALQLPRETRPAEQTGQMGFDAVLFDPFSPATNPRLWQLDVFQRTFELLKPGGTLTSYCVKGTVRRSLEEAGFRVSRVPGPTRGKREVLLAVKPSTSL